MNYTQAQIDRANAVSLEDFLHTQGETLIKSGREYRWKEHDSLTVRGNKWFRHSQSKGGYPIDFVMEFYGKSFPEAVQLLTGESGEGQTEATTAPPAEFHLPLHNRTVDRAIQYLCESRGLNKALVEAFLLSGDIYEDAKRHRITTSSCGWWWSTANRGKWKRRRRSCISIMVKCRSPRHRKNSPDTSTFTASTKTNSTAPAKNISCLPSTRSAINA